ncbi:DUF4446 family protein [Paenibacillus harenae]|uniref:ABC-type transporter Mla subunit MlaD n=1 Tax=Paenibacillus harenae TaxID=306543 RepID=A0ABT9U264_PAEHA|nr:DUF4446 family protein [Paenibacillus harenae]MDQ0061534.1 ABC-type transporter Mla subunit MlaD [Paenibacillus harenae]MDQ0113171.1 ABC-type transporter Mla subunit MlaD [Paenibacillus harenae]
MEDWTTNPMNAVTAAVGLIVIILFIWIALLGSKLKRLRKQYTDVMGNTGITNFEDVIVQMKEGLNEQAQTIQRLQTQLSAVEQALSQQKGRVGALRYNAFAEKGSDLSFSIAIVNENNDGAVLSGIHSRENTYVYAKPIEKGESAYPLTPEERKAIQTAK